MIFTVYGRPQPKGSLRGVVSHGRAVLIPDSAGTGRLHTWQTCVVVAARVAGVPCLTGPVSLAVDFRLLRRAGPARDLPDRKGDGDLDKLVRGVLDALTGIAYQDDSQVLSLVATKGYAKPGLLAGADIIVRPWGTA